MDTSSSVSPVWAAMSATDGSGLPGFWVSSRRATRTLLRSSWILRGTRSAHMRSRKWRLTSPVMVGTA